MLLAFTGLAAMLWAVPAKRGVTKTVMGADGQEMTVTLRGDETFHYYVNSNGTPVCEQADGTWAEDTRDVKTLWKQAYQKRNYSRSQLAERVHKAMKAPKRVGESTGVTGTKKGLLILVNFQDVEMLNGNESQAIFDQMLNAIGNPYGKNYGSVREYFRAQSYGQLDIEFDVVGPVTVSQNMSYYGANDSEGNDKAPEKMVNEACQLVNSEVDFSDYDWDGDGEVENIYVTYAGYGEADGGASNTIWPHQYYLSAASLSLKLDGVKIDTYACGAELNGEGAISGIGTMCHEYSHCLGLPDFYDVDYSGGHGMFDWDIMDGGSYNGDGYCPAGYTAYERWFSGWLEPVELNSSRNVNGMKPIEDEPEAYIIYNDGNRNEYYMLANHQQKGWDKAESGKGLLILHVDYSKSVWDNNGPNDDPDHQRMTIIPADNKFNYRTYQGDKYYYGNDGDTWPGSTNNTALTDTSTPKASLYNKNTDGTNLMHKPIEDITETDGLISFNITIGDSEQQESEAKLITLDFTSNTWGLPEGSTNKTTATKSFTDNVGNTITLTGSSGNGYYFNTSSGYLLLGKQDATLTLPVFDFAVSKIVVTGKSGASSSTGMNVYVGNNEVSTSTTGSADVNTYEISEAYQAAGNVYTLKITTAHNAQFTKIEIYGVDDETPELPQCAKPSISYKNGKLQFDCETEGVEFVYNVSSKVSSGKITSGTVDLETTFTVSVYATREGYKNSETETVTIDLAKVGDINGDGEIGIADVTALVNIILGKSTPTGR